MMLVASQLKLSMTWRKNKLVCNKPAVKEIGLGGGLQSQAQGTLRVQAGEGVEAGAVFAPRLQPGTVKLSINADYIVSIEA